jgi:hypothetical protein
VLGAWGLGLCFSFGSECFFLLLKMIFLMVCSDLGPFLKVYSRLMIRNNFDQQKLHLQLQKRDKSKENIKNRRAMPFIRKTEYAHITHFEYPENTN